MEPAWPDPRPLDGNDVGDDQHQAIEVPVEPGPRTLQVKAGRSTADDAPLTRPTERSSIRCNGAVIWPVYLASIVKPDLALTLKHK